MRRKSFGLVLAFVLGLAGVTASGAPSASAATCGDEVVVNGGLETGTAPWTASSGVISTATAAQPAYGGTKIAWLDGYGSSHTDTLSQSVTLPAGCTSGTLTYWLHIDTKETTTTTAYDRLTTQIGTTTVASYSNLDQAPGYQQRTIDVTPYLGQTVTVKFTGIDDAGLTTNFVLDNLALNTTGGSGSHSGSATFSWIVNPTTFDGTRTPVSPNYTVSLTSNTAGDTWTGTESVSFTNASTTPLPEVYLRLWDNSHDSCPSTPITLSNVTGGTPAALSVDCTALKITLPSPLAKGQSGTIGFNLGIVVPSGADRFGHDGANNFIGNALPVLAVRDTAGWHLDSYTGIGESFYALISNFDVTLVHPTALQTPTSGTSTQTTSGSTTTTHAIAANVRDFAWAAGPFTKISGTSAKGFLVNVYAVSAISPAHAQLMLTVARDALDAHSDHFGDYPYQEADVVLDNNFWFGGMEYPGLVLAVVSSTALAHELAHQWFYGIVGDDEYTTPWLDEGFTDYATDLYNGITGSGCGITWQSAAEKLTNSMAYWDEHSSRYNTVIYGYGKCTLHDLRRLIGDPAMANLMKSYAQSHWYGISTVADFKAAAQAAAGSTDLTSFWTSHRVEG
jgi:hypothetical protein